jgi:ArsR family transcriptional regulator, virulence genes transcriptional regulator
MNRSLKKSQVMFSPEEMEQHAEEAAALLKALAHPARLLVLCQLVEGECSVGELQPITGLSMSALSQHLSVLREMELVTTRRESQTIYYTLAQGPAVGVLEVLNKAYCKPARSRR